MLVSAWSSLEWARERTMSQIQMSRPAGQFQVPLVAVSYQAACVVLLLMTAIGSAGSTGLARWPRHGLPYPLLTSVDSAFPGLLPPVLPFVRFLS